MNFNDFNTVSKAQASSYESGLRAYMIGIFNKMFLALGWTGMVSFLLSTNEQAMRFMFQSKGLMIVLCLAMFGIAMTLAIRLYKMQVSTANGLFWAYATLTGVSLSPIFVIYTGSSISLAFFSSAALFGGMSLIGYTTRKDLTSLGTFVFVGMIVVLITSLVNTFFLHNSGLSLALSAIMVFIFCGLTAYDVQKIKELYNYAPSNESLSKFAIFGAFNLYLDFINLFTHLLRLIGDRRN